MGGGSVGGVQAGETVDVGDGFRASQKRFCQAAFKRLGLAGRRVWSGVGSGSIGASGVGCRRELQLVAEKVESVSSSDAEWRRSGFSGGRQSTTIGDQVVVVWGVCREGEGWGLDDLEGVVAGGHGGVDSLPWSEETIISLG